MSGAESLLAQRNGGEGIRIADIGEYPGLLTLASGKESFNNCPDFFQVPPEYTAKTREMRNISGFADEETESGLYKIGHDLFVPKIVNSYGTSEFGDTGGPLDYEYYINPISYRDAHDILPTHSHPTCARALARFTPGRGVEDRKLGIKWLINFPSIFDLELITTNWQSTKEKPQNAMAVVGTKITTAYFRTAETPERDYFDRKRKHPSLIKQLQDRLIQELSIKDNSRRQIESVYHICEKFALVVYWLDASTNTFIRIPPRSPSLEELLIMAKP